MSKKVEFIRQACSDKKCYNCNGTGKLDNEKQCDRCEGTGVFIDTHYIMVTNGIAFGVDTIK